VVGIVHSFYMSIVHLTVCFGVSPKCRSSVFKSYHSPGPWHPSHSLLHRGRRCEHRLPHLILPLHEPDAFHQRLRLRLRQAGPSLRRLGFGVCFSDLGLRDRREHGLLRKLGVSFVERCILPGNLGHGLVEQRVIAAVFLVVLLFRFLRLVAALLRLLAS